MGGQSNTQGKGESIGLIAGNGTFPLRFAEGARRAGCRVVVVALKGETTPEIERYADSIHWTGIAQVGRWIKIFRQERVTRAALCGGVSKGRIYDPRRILNYAPDARTLKLWFTKAKSKRDHDILGLLAEELASEGIELVSSVLYCPELLVQPGCLTRRRPTEAQMRDIEFGWPIAKEIARLQIGQTIVVKEQCVIAVEGVEGTDAVIRRGGELGRGGVVVIKVAKHDHDERFDIPTIGPRTAETLREAGAAALAVEAGKTILLEPEETARLADEAGICIFARQ